MTSDSPQIQKRLIVSVTTGPTHSQVDDSIQLQRLYSSEICCLIHTAMTTVQATLHDTQ